MNRFALPWLVIVAMLIAVSAPSADVLHQVLLIEFSSPKVSIDALQVAVTAHLSDQPVRVSVIDGTLHRETEALRHTFAVAAATDTTTVVWIDPEGTTLFLLTPKLSKEIKRRDLDAGLETWVIKCELAAAMVRHEIDEVKGETDLEARPELQATLPTHRGDPDTAKRARRNDLFFESALGIGYSPGILSFNGPVMHSMDAGLLFNIGKYFGFDIGAWILGRHAVSAAGDEGTYSLSIIRIHASYRMTFRRFDIRLLIGPVLALWRIRGLKSPIDREVLSLHAQPGLTAAASILFRLLERAALFFEVGADCYLGADRFEVSGRAVLVRDAVQLRLAAGVAIWIAWVKR